jgi:hypothetical protein
MDGRVSIDMECLECISKLLLILFFAIGGAVGLGGVVVIVWQVRKDNREAGGDPISIFFKIVMSALQGVCLRGCVLCECECECACKCVYVLYVCV